jgi:hypothetical protein
MKTLLVCVLLTAVPFAGLRVVCLDAHAAGATRSTVADAAGSTQAAAESECDRICVKHAAPQPPPTPGMTCLLIADPACAFIATAAVAVMPRDPVMPAADGAARVEPIPAGAYLPPILARRSPPPRA